MGDEADGGAVVLAAGVAGGDGRLRVLAGHDGAQRPQALERRVGARVLVAVDQAGAGLALPDLDRDELLREDAVLRGYGSVVGAERQLVLLFTRDRVLAAEVL